MIHSEMRFWRLFLYGLTVLSLLLSPLTPLFAVATAQVAAQSNSTPTPSGERGTTELVTTSHSNHRNDPSEMRFLSESTGRASFSRFGDSELIYRTRITIRHATDWQRLEKLGVLVLQRGADWALVLVDEQQLETLARLRFAPSATDGLTSLVTRHAEEKSWLVESMQPLLAQMERLRSTTRSQATQMALREAVRALTFEQQTAIASLSSIDDDGDGLTNVEEGWWCTDPLNANSDGDAQEYTDGQEVTALLDFTQPRNVRWGYGPPFGPPNAWPDWNGQDGDANTPACNDGDYDTIPDFAEVFMVGSRVPVESTDHDKFDDGQELFGLTYCPGAPTSCGYGSYPRIEYWTYIKATMPSWVEAPGDNIFVAAFPVPEVSVVPGSWTVERVTTITTEEGQLAQTTHNYETSVTRGQSTSIANTVTWNEWEEVSQAVETPLGRNHVMVRAAQDFWDRAWGGAKFLGGSIGGIVTGAGATISTALCVIPDPSDVTVIVTPLACGSGVALGAASTSLFESAGNGWQELTSGTTPNNRQEEEDTNNYSTSNPIYNNVKASASANASVTLNQNFDFQGLANSLDGVQYAINQQGALLARGLQDVSYAISQPRFTETRTNGRSWGGAQTTTHEVYEEHTVTQGEAFTSGQNWSTAWAVDSSHAADLTFNYTIQNSGTEYTRELTGLLFNIYLGDDTTPIISYPAWEQFPDGKLENLFPDDTHTFASTSVSLTLEQMKRIDLGERLTVVLEDFSYGADELFYQDAINGGVTVFIEDGVHDGDELVDSYVIPTWGTESVQDVLTRYFPAGYDAEGNLNALWTPEFDGSNPPTWYEHYLSDISWWNIYLTQPDAGNTPLNQLSAQAGSALLFRFNRDSDRDGYKDSVERRYGTDKDDPASHPQPEVLAGYVASRDGDTVTVKLALENSGTFDAYGIDAVMYAPDSSTTIGNNTVGGNGRVRPGGHVAVGSLVKGPGLANWGNSTANPYAGGNYAGDSDRTYTFSVSTPGVVGQGSSAINWSDDAGDSGTLELGSDYQAPLPLELSQGVEVGFNTGTILAGTSFTVTALTPRDTFTYTINSESFTPPVIVVSYSDPQGSHRFITPVELPDLESDLAPYSGQMLTDLGLEIVTSDIVQPSQPLTTTFVFNNPHPATIEDAHLYLNFVSDGALVAEMPFTLTLSAGPTTYPVVWSTDAFSQTYDPDADNILIAFWTDAQNNIIDSAARPLNSFADDPDPSFATQADAIWDFGTATQGEILTHTVTIASTGFLNLSTYLTDADGISVSGPSSRRVAPGDTTPYVLTLDSRQLAVGAYEQTLTLRTSDPDNPTHTVQVVGTISDTTPVARTLPYRPLDLNVTIPGTYSTTEWITFTHTLQPDAQSLHPVRLYSQDYETLWGMGKYATAFGDGANLTETFFQELQAIPTFGGHDWHFFTIGDEDYLALANYANWPSLDDPVDYSIDSKLYKWNSTEFEEFQAIPTVGATDWESFIIDNEYYLAIANGGAREQEDVNSHIYKFNGTDFEYYQSIATRRATDWEFFTIGSDHYLAVANHRVPHNSYQTYSKIYRWNGASFVEFQSITTIGAVDWEFFTIGSDYYLAVANNRSGGNIGNVNSKIYKWNGASFVQFQTIATNAASDWEFFTIGNEHYLAVANQHYNQTTVNIESKIYRWNGTSFELFQAIMSNGGTDWEFFTIGREHYLALGNYYYFTKPPSKIYWWDDSNFVEVQTIATNGAVDWEFFTIRNDHYLAAASHRESTYDYNQDSTIYINPLAHVVEQVEADPYNSGLLNLPEPFTNGQSYKVQYARRLLFSNTQELTTTLRVPAESFSNATLDALVSDVVTDSLTFRLDVGDDGSWDWQATQSVTNTATLATSNLASAFNAYWNSQGAPTSGTLDVPVRVSLSEGGQVLLTNLVMSATPPDATLSASDITFGASSVIEGENVPITATLHNSEGMESGPLTGAFYAEHPNWGDWYIGSAFVPTIGANGTAEASIIWQTLGFTGTVPVRVEVDPFNRVAESNENNNHASADLTILARPDLHLSTVSLSNEEPVVGESVTVTLTVHNAGQATADGQTMALFEGNPDSGGTLIGEQVTSSLSGGAESSVTFTWLPNNAGAHRLFASLDTTEQVDESNESNNQSWHDLYVGLAGPLLADSGAADEPAYSAESGYGYLNGQASTFCGTQPEQSQRSDASGEVRYRFDHLLPGHFYHLDITLKECDGLGREQMIRVDDNQVSEVVPLSDGEAHRLSILLDPALYADNEIIITVEELIGYDAIVAEVNLHDVDYRYADSGGINDPAYPTTPQGRPTRQYGWLDGVVNMPWGTLPYQSRRIDLADSNPADDPDNELRYRFDGLEPNKRYQLNLTFFQNAGGLVQQTIYADEYDSGLSVELNGQQRVDHTIELPSAAYATDGSVIVRIVRTNTAAGAFVNTIALEEETQFSTMIWPISLELGWNHIAWPLEPPVPYSAQSLCEEINSQGGDIVEIDRFINGGWEGHICGQEFNNFEIEMGRSYFIKSNASSSWNIKGRAALLSSLALEVGWNAITVPHTDAYSAESLCDELISQGVTAVEIDRWHNGGWQGHICGLPFNDFQIERGRGYFVKTTSAGTVTPSAFASRQRTARTQESISLDELPTGPFQPIGDLHVSNLRDTSVTLSWLTEKATTGYVTFASSPTGQERVAYDSRGATTSSTTHLVVLNELTPETTYDFQIISGQEVGESASFTTAPSLMSVPDSDTIYGRVYQADGQTPAAGALVYLTLQDADSPSTLRQAQGGPGSGTSDTANAALMSGLVDENGYWHANLGNARSPDGRLFDYSPSGDELLIEVVSSTEVQAEGTASQTIKSAWRDTTHDAQIPDMILSDVDDPTSISVAAFERISTPASWLGMVLAGVLMLAGTLLIWRRWQR